MEDNTTLTITESSGNVFADMGLDNPEERLLKARLASRIFDVLTMRQWQDAQAATDLQLPLDDLQDILQGRLDAFSVAELLTFLQRMNQRISIDIEDVATGQRYSHELAM